MYKTSRIKQQKHDNRINVCTNIFITICYYNDDVMVYETGYNKNHKCAIMEWCILNNEWKLLFCIVCRRVTGYERPDGSREFVDVKVTTDATKQKEYSEKTLEDNI